MKKMFLLEFRRSILGNGMKVIIILSFAPAISQMIGFHSLQSRYDNFQEANKIENGDYAVGVYPNTLYESFLAGEDYTVFNSLYYMLLPLYAVLPFGISFYIDENSGYLKNIYCRVKKKNYIFAKYLAVFLSGAIASGMPFALSLVLTALKYPAVLPNSMAMQNHIVDASLLSEMYNTYPMIYVLFYLGIVMLFGGFLATVALVVSFSARNYLAVFFAPFMLYLVQYYGMSQFSLGQYSIYDIVNMSSGNSHMFETVGMIVVYILVSLLITFVAFMAIGMKREKIV